MKKSLFTLLIGIALSAASSMASAQFVAPKTACDEQTLKESPAVCDRLQKGFVSCSRESSYDSFEKCVDAYADKNPLNCSLEADGERKEMCAKANSKN